MRLGCGLPMGPLALMDLIGLDTAYEILDTMYRRGGRDRRHAPVPLLKQMVTAGLLGRKSGARLLHVRAAGLPGRRRRRSYARVRDSSAGPPVDHPAVGVVGASASSARARWRPASSRSSPGRVLRVVSVARGAEPAVAAESVRQRAEQGSRARQADARPTGTRRWPGSPGRPRSTDLADVDLVVEAVVEELERQESRSSPPGRDLQAGRDPRHDDVDACRSSSAPWRPSDRRTWSACTSSTRHR